MVGRLSIPSTVRLQPLDDCLRNRCDAPDLAHTFAEKLRFTGKDGELRVAGDAPRQGTVSVGSGEVVDEVVERRAKVVDAVADKESEFGAGLPKDLSDDALLAALLIELDVGSVRVFFAPPTDFSFDALQVLRGPF